MLITIYGDFLYNIEFNKYKSGYKGNVIYYTPPTSVFLYEVLWIV